MYCPNNFTELLYASIRNALAHGNIVKKGKYFYLYFVSSKDEINVTEEERKITFLLKIKNLKKLNAYIEAFKKFN